MTRLVSCTARNGLIYDLAGTPYTISEAETRLSVVTDLAGEDGDLTGTYARRASELLSALIEAKRQAYAPANDDGGDFTPPPAARSARPADRIAA